MVVAVRIRMIRGMATANGARYDPGGCRVVPRFK